MKLKEYIEELEKIVELEGDLEMYTASDPEGNSYNKVYYAPEVKLLPEDEVGNSRLDYIYDNFESAEETLEDYCLENDLDEEDFDKMRKVVLL